MTVCACFTYLLPLIGCLTSIVGYKASRKKAIARSPHIPHSLITVRLLTQHHSPPPVPYSQTASRLLVPYEHPSVNPPVAHCILRFPTPAPHTKRTSYTAVQQPAVRVGVGVVVASSPLGRTRVTRRTLRPVPSASSCWSALRSSLTRCLAESRVSLCAMPWSDTRASSSSVKRGMASAILPCFSSRSAKL